ncbi:tyrosine-type recombinase/integrase [Enterobacteriaceae bacterium 4M9]|nr:tyrosine-type recombinase/integrase [Enterobacteriaceae bacterium 4M9]
MFFTCHLPSPGIFKIRCPVDHWRAGRCGKNHCVCRNFPGRAVRNPTKLIVVPRTFYVGNNLTNGHPAWHGCEAILDIERVKLNIEFNIRESGIREKGSCHLFRHTMSTQMLEHGAELRWIQAILGHTDISTTQVYTRVSIRMLREIHRATHPAEKASVPDEK